MKWEIGKWEVLNLKNKKIVPLKCTRFDWNFGKRDHCPLEGTVRHRRTGVSYK